MVREVEWEETPKDFKERKLTSDPSLAPCRNPTGSTQTGDVETVLHDHRVSGLFRMNPVWKKINTHASGQTQLSSLVDYSGRVSCAQALYRVIVTFAYLGNRQR